MTDHRRHQRIRFEARATVTDGCVETPAVGVDASPGGLGLRTAFLWEPGTRVSVRMRLEDATTAVVVAVVQRAEGDVMGLRLLAGGPAFIRTFGRGPDLALSA
jgi:hypothetical protein